VEEANVCGRIEGREEREEGKEGRKGRKNRIDTAS
jgi:hypothetical protein